MRWKKLCVPNRISRATVCERRMVTCSRPASVATMRPSTSSCAVCSGAQSSASVIGCAALATTGRQRAAALPEVPTLDEAGLKGYETTSWFALLAPARTPTAVIERLQQEIARALATPAVRERLAAQGLTPVGSTPAQFDAFMRAEIAKYARVIKDAGVKID